MRAKLLVAVATIEILIAMGGSSSLADTAKPTPDEYLVEQLLKAGADISKPQPIGFVFHFPTKESADRIAVELLARSLSDPIVEPTRKGSMWKLGAMKTMVPKAPDLARLRKEFEALIAPEMGVYDEWGSAFVK